MVRTGLIVAESYRKAREAAKLVKVTYDTSSSPKPILSLDDAIARKSFFLELLLLSFEIVVIERAFATRRAATSATRA